MNKNEHFLHRFVTDDKKKRVLKNNKRSRQWLTPAIPYSKRCIVPVLRVWWDSLEIIHYELMPTAQTFTGEINRQQLAKLHKKLKNVLHSSTEKAR